MHHTTHTALRYERRAARPDGVPEDPARCVEEVRGSGWHQVQCSRRRGHGPQGRYCRQHADRLARHAAAVGRTPEDLSEAWLERLR